MPFWEGQETLTPLQWVIRAAVMYTWLLFIAKLMGQREVGRLTLFDFVISIIIGTVSASPLTNSRTDVSGAIIAVSTLGAFDIALSYLSLWNAKFRRVVQDEPIVLVQNGQLLEDTMRRTRFNLDDLLAELRQNNVPNLSDVEFAILEPNGKLSVIPKSQARPLTPRDLNVPTPYEGMPTVLIEDGNILQDNLRKNQLDETWLLGQLRQQGVNNPNDVLAVMLDTQGRLFVSKKNQTNEQFIQ